MSLITPTFGDKGKPEISPQGDAGAAPVKVVAQHEPLSINPWNGLGNTAVAMQTALAPPAVANALF